MSLLTIRIYGDPVLREKSRDIEESEINTEFHRLVADMGETMYEAGGIGLAANQVGETRRFFVADWDQVTGNKKGKRVRDPKNRRLTTFINPEIIDSSEDDDEYQEGCLSIPQVDHDVFRPTKILVRYRTIDWELHEEWLDDLPARVFQHELDHLDGILFIDRIPASARATLAGELNRIKRSQQESAVHG